MHQALAAWILSVLVAIGGTREWKASYPETADAMAAEAVAGPLFDGEAAEYRTAALEIAVAEKEGGFNPKAINTDGGRQLCFFQVHEVNRKFLGLKDAEELYQPKTCVRAGMVLMRRSFSFCRAKKRLESWFLAQYASGRESCDYGVDASRERMGLGEWIFGRYASNP